VRKFVAKDLRVEDLQIEALKIKDFRIKDLPHADYLCNFLRCAFLAETAALRQVNIV
jgi:hypothetical protein